MQGLLVVPLDYKGKEKDEGFMLKHILEKHGGDMKNEFMIKREKVDKDPMRRILRESIRIENAERDVFVLNILRSMGKEKCWKGKIEGKGQEQDDYKRKEGVESVPSSDAPDSAECTQ